MESATWKPSLHYAHGQVYFWPSGAMKESGLWGPYLDVAGPYKDKEQALAAAQRMQSWALEILSEEITDGEQIRINDL